MKGLMGKGRENNVIIMSKNSLIIIFLEKVPPKKGENKKENS